MSDDIGTYRVEIAVTGTWRDSVVAESEDEAANEIEGRMENLLISNDAEWGDLGMRVVGVEKESEN